MKPLTSMFRDISKAAFRHGIRTYANAYRGYYIGASELKEMFRINGFNVDERNAWTRFIQTWLDGGLMVRVGYAYFVIIDYELDDLRNTAGECLYQDRLENCVKGVVYVDSLSKLVPEEINGDYSPTPELIDLQILAERRFNDGEVA